MMRFIQLAAAALTLWLASLSLSVAAEVIHSFDSTVVLAKDGELTVTERIRVRAEGSAIRRGIFRDFPLTFTDAQGKLREVSFTLLDVTRDGKPEPHFTERKNNTVLRIYAGDKDTLLQPGDYTYVIRYRTARQVRWFDGKPELNWNVTGNFWTFPISAASYRLELADGMRPTRWTAFTGPRGARGTDWRGAINGDGALTVSTTRPLRAGDGLTVVAALPDGAVMPPTQADEVWYAFVDNRAWFFGGIGFVLVLIYYLAAWSAVGRDPKRGTIIPLFYPPKDISPALANYIENWGFGREKWRAFTAAALSLAVSGLVRFDNSGGALNLRATDKDPMGGTPLAAGERAIITKVNARGGTLVIDKKHGDAVADVGNKFTAAIELENKNRFFRRNLGYVVAGALMTAAVIVGIIAFGGLEDEDIVIIVFAGFGGFWCGIFLVPIISAVTGVSSFATAVRAALTLIVLGIFGMIAYTFVQNFLPNGLSSLLPEALNFVEGHPLPFLLVGGFAALNGLFVYLMRAPTALGRPIMDQLAGFKLYLETAEKDRLNLQAPEITAERFEALLPYAVALDVEKPWSDAFAAALKRAHPEDADPMRHYQPVWTSGSWSSSDFGGAVAATVASASSALSSAVPASSSSSGFSSDSGGGSGGGGGGGGGGGW
ncbi:DUF2207 domain-containing protein [Microbacteriaceae bacterium K1510]|nr:DUF2207 domain-containing protein [Microbacteriaceae bacterium K1510]